MNLGKRFSWAIFIGLVMSIFQILDVGGHLPPVEIYLFNDTASSSINMTPLYENIQLLLKNPQHIYTYIEVLHPNQTGLFTGIQGITGVSTTGLLRTILYLTSFTYFAVITFLFAKASTIFVLERDQKIFFSFLCLLYFIIIKVLGSI